MLKVKTKLGPSSIAGIVLFADEFIPEGTIVWEYNNLHDKVYTQEELDSANELDKEFLNTYCFKFMSKYYLCVDNARFFNHADKANCYSSDFNENSLGFTKAIRDILPGEELTDNYIDFGLTNEDKEWNKQEF